MAVTVGVYSYMCVDKRFGRAPIIVEIFYPAEGEDPHMLEKKGPWMVSRTARDASIASTQVRYPLVVLSHEHQGSRYSSSWIAEALARHGYVVASVEHPGDTFFSPSVDKGLLQHWRRATDISTVLDNLLSDEFWRWRINPNKIGMIGVEMGATTALWLVGARADPYWFPRVNSQYIDLYSRRPLLQERISFTSLKGMTDSYRDPRIQAVLLMAPVLVKGFTPESLKDIQKPMAILAAEQDHKSLFEDNTEVLSYYVSGEKRVVFTQGADERIFYNYCSRVGKVSMPHICKKIAPVKRTTYHRYMTDFALTFFKEALTTAG